ncbi:MAG: exodeoxyribonuclease VII small subunit [Prevotella sp.]|nr:exodeoxyribonuclease VII small subunit [Prevotella sp.]
METIKYEQALRELETIAGQIESGDIGIDELSARIKRAKELIRLCKERLRLADEEIKNILAGDGESMPGGEED